MGDTYTHGHHDAVLRSHRWRTAENSAAYLLPHLTPGMSLLDVGCGPGNITADLATIVAPGETIGVDAGVDVIAQAERDHGGDPSPKFAVGDGYALGFEDDTFDVVHAHQVLQHLTDPVAALREWRRVLKPGGILAVRDSIYASKAWGPDEPQIDRWLKLYTEVTRRNDADCNAGRYLAGWARQAGFDDVTFTSTTWTYAGADLAGWWSDLWAERVVASTFAEQAVEYGLATTEDLQEIAEGWRRWGASPDAVFIVVLGEVIARR